jgi:hypothetical protein
MALQYSVAVRNARNDAIETTISTAPDIEIFTGSQPANCAAADSGTKIAEGTLPSDWLGASASGVKSKAGTWTVTGITAAGAGATMGHFRIKQGSDCHIQGSVTITGGGGEMTVNNTSIADTQVVTISSASITGSNA